MTTKMQALVWDGPRQMSVVEMPAPSAAPGEVVVEVAACGICGSELEGWDGRMKNRTPPLVMGHELGGTVVAVGDGVDTTLIGLAVAVNPLMACGSCDRCQAAQPNLCSERGIIGINRPGGFAGRVAVPAENLLALPPAVTPELGALVEPLANVIHAVDLAARAGAPASLLVLGAGSLGLLTTQVARVRGIATIVVADLQDDRLATAAAVGATATVNNRSADAAEQLAALLPAGADAVIDCVGAAPTKQQALRSVRSGGTVVLVGLHDDDSPLSAHEIIRREITLTGSYTYTPADLSAAVDLLASGAIVADGWTTTLDLAEGPQAFADLVSNPGAFTKVLLVP